MTSLGGKVRQLAQQSRDDVYASMRDYQELHTAQGEAFRPDGGGDHRLAFTARANVAANSDFVGAGLYVNPSAPVRLGLTLTADGEESTVTTQLGGGHWNRVGVAVEALGAADIRVDVCWAGAVDVSVWGLSAGPLELPEVLLSSEIGVTEFNQTHLAPETFYLVQDVGVIFMGAAVADIPLHGYQIFDDRLASVELENAVVTVTDPRDIATYLRLFVTMSQAAEFGQAARSRLAEIGSTLDSRR